MNRKAEEEKPRHTKKTGTVKKKTKTGLLKKKEKVHETPPKSSEADKSPVPSVGTPPAVQVSKETTGVMIIFDV